MKPKILFISPVLQYPPHGGPALRIANTIKVLAERSDLTIACRQPMSDLGSSTFKFLQAHSREVVVPECKESPKSGLHQIVGKIVRRVTGGSMPQPIDYGQYADHIYQQLEVGGFDAVWLGYGNISYPLLKQIKDSFDIPVIADTDSVWSRFVLRGLPFAKDEEDRARILKEGSAKEAEEAWGTKLSDVTTAVSEVDAVYYRGLVDDPVKVFIFSNVVDVATYAPSPPPPNGFQSESVFLAGTFWPASPMEQAARWYINEVLPLVRQTHPNVHLYIVGKNSDAVLADINDEHITITGRVESVLPYLCNAKAAIVPLWFESGTRFKILEAGACGIPVVSTTLGAEGIPVCDGQNILLGDTPETFAHGIVRLLEQPDLAKSIASSLRNLVANAYALPKLREEAGNILRYLTSRRAVTTSAHRDQA